MPSRLLADLVQRNDRVHRSRGRAPASAVATQESSARAGPRGQGGDYWSCPKSAVRTVPARLLLLCLLLRSSWLTVEGGRQIGAAGVLHGRGERAAVAVSVGVAVGVPDQQGRTGRSGWSILPQVARVTVVWARRG